MAGDAPGQGGPRALTDADRLELAFQLRLSHRTYSEIAARLGITRQVAHRMVKSRLDARAKLRAQEAAALAQHEITRCEEVEAALWPKRGQPKEALALAVWTDRRLRLQGFQAEPPGPPIDREALKLAVAEALGITVHPRALPAGQRVVEVAAHGEAGAGPDDAVPEDGVHRRGVG